MNTLTTIGPGFTVGGSTVRTEHKHPIDFRLGRRNGELVLQGLYPWWTALTSGSEWRDVPIVDLDKETK